MRFKKYTSFFLVILMLVSNIGLALNVHYCGENVASVSFDKKVYTPKEEKCCAVNKTNKTCCKDKVVVVEKKSDNATVKSFSFEIALPFVNQLYVPLVFEEMSFSLHSKILPYYVEANAPPLYQQYHQLIFYA
ncbi:HYC_CC_PP family protein [Flavobacterium agrisoli]|uniref:Uncharacterized protein n=1 Tax=Flavobacterium agrisoli TaxID=2793066 RepID=A0A934PP15_9FLAO|nr:hypothetical protein [Flavobacterium agrisoli]MBK0370400.1 hypothetical protein [Flavobacterium agrisoli]